MNKANQIKIKISGNKIDENITDSFTYALLSWGISDPELIDWQIYKNEITLDISTSTKNKNYSSITIDYPEFNQLMELCYPYEVLFEITDLDDETTETIHYLSPSNSTKFKVY